MNTALDNKTLRLKHESYTYVIVANVGPKRTEKYVSRSFPYGYCYTVCLEKAKSFQTESSADKFLKQNSYILEKSIIRCMKTKRELIGHQILE